MVVRWTFPPDTPHFKNLNLSQLWDPYVYAGPTCWSTCQIFSTSLSNHKTRENFGEKSKILPQNGMINYDVIFGQAISPGTNQHLLQAPPSNLMKLFLNGLDSKRNIKAKHSRRRSFIDCIYVFYLLSHDNHSCIRMKVKSLS